MLAAQMRGNYERIRTWQGRYAVHKRVYGSAAKFGDALAAGKVQTRPDSRYVDDLEYTMDFAIDMSSGSIFRSKDSSKLTFLEEKTGKRFQFPNVGSRDERSVVTPEHYLHFTGQVGGKFRGIDDPRAMNRRAAFRDPLKMAERQHFADLVDPRLLLSESGDRMFWDVLEFRIKAGRGEIDPKSKMKFERGTHLYQAMLDGKTWYRTVLELHGPGDSVGFTEIVFDPRVCFCPSQTAKWEGKIGGELRFSMTWTYAESGGVFVPEKVSQRGYEGGQVQYDRDLRLDRNKINEPLAPGQFSYEGLGMKDGDLVMDRIDGVCSILEGGKPQKIANIDEKYLPEESLRAARRRRWLAWGVGSGILAVVLAVAWLRYRKPRKTVAVATRTGEGS
jgi:hypothetical protein